MAEEIVTYRVEDRTGHHRILGTTQDKARAVAESLADDLIAAPLKLQRVTVTMTRHVEDVQTFGVEPAAAPGP